MELFIIYYNSWSDLFTQQKNKYNIATKNLNKVQNYNTYLTLSFSISVKRSTY